MALGSPPPMLLSDMQAINSRDALLTCQSTHKGNKTHIALSLGLNTDFIHHHHITSSKTAPVGGIIFTVVKYYCIISLAVERILNVIGVLRLKSI